MRIFCFLMLLLFFGKSSSGSLEILLHWQTYQIVDLVEEGMDFLAVDETDVRLAQKSPDLPSDRFLVDLHHDHHGYHVVQHRR